MVSRLAWLKARLLWNGLRADWQRRISFPLMLALLTGAGWFLTRSYLETMERVSAPAGREFSLWAALTFWAVWTTLPVVIFPLDENLDPAQFALSPVPPRQLISGLAAAALVAPSTAVPLLTLGANIYQFRVFLVPGIVSAILFVLLLIVSGQLFTTVVSAVFRTRRGRDVAMLIVAGIGLLGFASQVVIRRVIDNVGLEAAVTTYPLSDWAALLPPVAVQRIVTDAAEGRIAGSAMWTVVAVAWILALSLMWHRLLRWMLTTPGAAPGPSRRLGRAGLAARGSWNARAVIARKELRFYVRDPRQRLVWTGAVIFLGLAAASVMFGTEGLGAFRTRSWIPLLAPALVLFIGLPIALNLFGWERNAASFLFVLPVRPRQLIMGKNLAAVTALVIETAALTALLAWLSDSWEAAQYVPALTVAAIGCQLAVGNLVSVVTPLRLPREGTDIFAQSTEQGCLAIGAQLVSFVVIGALLVLPASVIVLTIDFGRAVPAWFANAFSVAWGISFYLLSLWIAGSILKRRAPEVVEWVQVV